MWLTKRQFIEWSPAVLAAELSRGRKPRNKIGLYYRSRGLVGSDKIFMEKILLLVPYLDLNFIYGVVWDADALLDQWMFRAIADSILMFFKNDHRSASMLRYIHNVDNIIYLLSKNLSPEFIKWCGIRPLGKIRKLLPWIDVSDFHEMSDEQRAIMGDETILSFSWHRIALRVLRYNPQYKGIYGPGYYDNYDKKIITRFIDAGWKIILNLSSHTCGRSNMEELCDVIIAKGHSDWLFGDINPSCYDNKIKWSRWTGD